MAEEGKDWKDNYKNLRELLWDNKLLGENLDDEQFQREFEKVIYCFDSAKRFGLTMSALALMLASFIFWKL